MLLGRDLFPDFSFPDSLRNGQRFMTGLRQFFLTPRALFTPLSLDFDRELCDTLVHECRIASRRFSTSSSNVTRHLPKWNREPIPQIGELQFYRFRDMLPLNCQSSTSNAIGSSVSNGGSIQSLQSIDPDSPNLAMSPLSTMGMSPVGMNPCSPMGMSPMASHHHGYTAPVTPSSVHTAHPHNGGLSPMNDVKALCYGRGVYETGKFYSSPRSNHGIEITR